MGDTNTAVHQTTYAAVVGRILVRHRESLGLEQTNVAQFLGINQSTWSRMERGETAITIETLAKVAKLFETKPSVVLDEAEKAKKNLEEMNVSVLMDRAKTGGKAAVILLTGAILGLLIARALSK